MTSTTPASRAPRVSIVVPIYNVERYLHDCLESLAHQSTRDLEVVMVDDGATDSSAEIAASFAATDPRFLLVRQANGGLGHARNTGADRARGQYLAFVDSDDIVTPRAYELMAGSLDHTGSDFATGNFHRLSTVGTRQAGMVFTAFNANRPATHISKHPALLNDRTAWNKLFRRTFWDQHGFRWPEGVLYEDIPVTLPAHVLARAVDVLRDPVYLWRARVGDSTSITQRRTEPRAIRDRTAAVDGVSRFLAEHGHSDLKARYDKSVAAQDLRYFLQQLGEGDDEFQQLFLRLVNDFFDRAAPTVFDELPALERLEWHLVRRRLLAELLQVLAFDVAGAVDWTPVVRRRRALYGDYPFRGDPALAIPDEVYRLGKDELPVRARVEDIHWIGEVLHLSGHAHISFMAMDSVRAGRIRITVEESGHPESVVPLSVRRVLRPDVTASAPDASTCYDGSGWEATLPAAALRHRGRFRDGNWRFRVEVRAGSVTRRKWLSETAPGRAKRPPFLTVDGARLVATSPAGNIALEVSTSPAEVSDVRGDGGVFEIAGVLRGHAFDPATAVLRTAREDGTATLELPVATGGAVTRSGSVTSTPFVARVEVALLVDTGEGESVREREDLGDGVVWGLSLVPAAGVPRVALTAADDLLPVRLPGSVEGHEVLTRVTRTGRLEIVERRLRPQVDMVTWRGDELELSGSWPALSAGAAVELVLREAERVVEVTVPMERSGDRFTVRVPAEVTAGAADVPEGAVWQWDLYARPTSEQCPTLRIKTQPELLATLPRVQGVGPRTVTVVDVNHDDLALQVATARA